ncbi:SAM-dependent methyltransferase [Veronia pacifica]|uniref:Methyltransferase n=1 Tax=Veronia pacifica TaxID=1080227 RepID=A0A1C3EGA3_9GAMM|nr:SAM-dependent methyltransferase [Veronia pacifica]ODA32249.1 methyltransferase [Veronia pacifica]
MQNVDDVYGSALASYYNGDKSGNIIFRESEGASVVPTADFFRRPDEVKIDRIALSYCRRNVLNLGAGSGELSLYLYEKGIDVFSLDTSEVACAIMKQRGLTSVLSGGLFEQQAALPNTYTWLAVRGYIGQLGYIHNFIHFLELAKETLYPGGRVILSSMNLKKEGYRTKMMTCEFDGKVSEEYPKLDIGMSTLRRIADSLNFSCRFVLCDENSHYVALLIKK